MRSRSRKQYIRGVANDPKSFSKNPVAIRWLAIRCNSALITRIYWARSGTGMWASFSTVLTYPRLLDMLAV